MLLVLVRVCIHSRRPSLVIGGGTLGKYVWSIIMSVNVQFEELRGITLVI